MEVQTASMKATITINGRALHLGLKEHTGTRYFHRSHWELDQARSWGRAGAETCQGTSDPGLDLLTPSEHSDLAPLVSALHLQSFRLKHHN